LQFGQAGLPRGAWGCWLNTTIQTAENHITIESDGMGKIKVGILIGSDSDWPKIQRVTEALEEFRVGYEARVMSAHRTPDVVAEYARSARRRGLRVIIAAAGGAAHLAGVVAAQTTLPVIGLPVPTAELGGLDSLLSTVQMPGDVPVATMAVGMGGPRNAGLFAVQILATADEKLQTELDRFKESLADKIAAKDKQFQAQLATHAKA
jgi:phosphoribosylaminoimidazole carboxylase PurE protein